MCNLYSHTTNQQAIRDLFAGLDDRTGNLPPLPGIYPDYFAPIVRNEGARRVLPMARWGMPSPQNIQFEAAKKRAQKLEAKGKAVEFKELLRLEPDSGVTNIRNTGSQHWKQWLGLEHRCVVPFNSFSEFSKPHGGNIWFAFNEKRPLAFFAGLWVPQWHSVRKVKEGETLNDLYAFLTTAANAEVAPVHPKAMPVILTKPDEIETWLTAPAEVALKLQRPLADGLLKIVATGEKEDVLAA